MDSAIPPLLKAGVPAYVVQRFSHKRIEITLSNYAHMLPSIQQAAKRHSPRLFSVRDRSDARTAKQS